jgi:RNA recognition motif-containing protein
MVNLYVGNLSYNATEDELRSLFEPHGTVERVSVTTDRMTGRSRGFAFVEMEDEAGANAAIEALNETEFQGRNLMVNIARPKGERPARSRSRDNRW